MRNQRFLLNQFGLITIAPGYWGRWAGVFLVSIVFWGSALSGASVFAATLCVNPGGTSGCFALPSLAVAEAVDNDTIMIQPGTYIEAATITITQAGLKVLGDNPLNTTVTNSVSADVFTVTADDVVIAGLSITGGANGITIPSGTSPGGTDNVTIHHNHIVHNNGSGVISSASVGNSFVAYNNIVRLNSGDGIRSISSSSISHSNIVVENGGDGIFGGIANYNSSYGNGGLDFRSTLGNLGNITLDCLFVDESLADYRLQVASPCRDAGLPAFHDVDGTPSDMGSFGGPLAAGYWPYGNGGPVITDLTIDPVIVPRGGTLSITATGEIR